MDIVLPSIEVDEKINQFTVQWQQTYVQISPNIKSVDIILSYPNEIQLENRYYSWPMEEFLWNGHSVSWWETSASEEDWRNADGAEWSNMTDEEWGNLSPTKRTELIQEQLEELQKEESYTSNINYNSKSKSWLLAANAWRTGYILECTLSSAMLNIPCYLQIYANPQDKNSLLASKFINMQNISDNIVCFYPTTTYNNVYIVFEGLENCDAIPLDKIVVKQEAYKTLSYSLHALPQENTSFSYVAQNQNSMAKISIGARAYNEKDEVCDINEQAIDSSGFTAIKYYSFKYTSEHPYVARIEISENNYRINKDINPIAWSYNLLKANWKNELVTQPYDLLITTQEFIPKVERVEKTGIVTYLAKNLTVLDNSNKGLIPYQTNNKPVADEVSMFEGRMYTTYHHNVSYGLPLPCDLKDKDQTKIYTWDGTLPEWEVGDYKVTSLPNAMENGELYWDYELTSPSQYFSGGEGTRNNPYIITTPKQLAFAILKDAQIRAYNCFVAFGDLFHKQRLYQSSVDGSYYVKSPHKYYYITKTNNVGFNNLNWKTSKTQPSTFASLTEYEDKTWNKNKWDSIINQQQRYYITDNANGHGYATNEKDGLPVMDVYRPCNLWVHNTNIVYYKVSPNVYAFDMNGFDNVTLDTTPDEFKDIVNNKDTPIKFTDIQWHLHHNDRVVGHRARGFASRLDGSGVIVYNLDGRNVNTQLSNITDTLWAPANFNDYGVRIAEDTSLNNIGSGLIPELVGKYANISNIIVKNCCFDSSTARHGYTVGGLIGGHSNWQYVEGFSSYPYPEATTKVSCSVSNCAVLGCVLGVSYYQSKRASVGYGELIGDLRWCSDVSVSNCVCYYNSFLDSTPGKIEDGGLVNRKQGSAIDKVYNCIVLPNKPYPTYRNIQPDGQGGYIDGEGLVNNYSCCYCDPSYTTKKWKKINAANLLDLKGAAFIANKSNWDNARPVDNSWSCKIEPYQNSIDCYYLNLSDIQINSEANPCLQEGDKVYLCINTYGANETPENATYPFGNLLTTATTQKVTIKERLQVHAQPALTAQEYCGHSVYAKFPLTNNYTQILRAYSKKKYQYNKKSKTWEWVELPKYVPITFNIKPQGVE